MMVASTRLTARRYSVTCITYRFCCCRSKTINILRTARPRGTRALNARAPILRTRVFWRIIPVADTLTDPLSSGNRDRNSHHSAGYYPYNWSSRYDRWDCCYRRSLGQHKAHPQREILNGGKRRSPSPRRVARGRIVGRAVAGATAAAVGGRATALRGRAGEPLARPAIAGVAGRIVVVAERAGRDAGGVVAC